MYLHCIRVNITAPISVALLAAKKLLKVKILVKSTYIATVNEAFDPIN